MYITFTFKVFIISDVLYAISDDTVLRFKSIFHVTENEEVTLRYVI